MEEGSEKDLLDFKFENEEPYINLGVKMRVKLSLIQSPHISESGFAWVSCGDKGQLYICTKDCYLQRRVKRGNDYVLEEEVPISGMPRRPAPPPNAQDQQNPSPQSYELIISLELRLN